MKPENILVQLSGHVTLTDFDLSRTLKKTSEKSILASSMQTQPPLEPASKKRHHHLHRSHLTRWVSFVSKSSSNNGNNIKGLEKTKSARVSPMSRRKHSFSEGERSNSFVGTEEYVSPEVLRGDKHEIAVDWWALGSYEMLYGTTPFKGKNRKETFQNVLGRQPEFVGKRNELTDLIQRLLEKDPAKRPGYSRGGQEIKGHPFFGGVRWNLLTKVLRPPFIPSRDEGDSMDWLIAGGIDIKEYFENLRAPPSMLPSPLQSPTSDQHRKLSEF